MLGLRNTSVAEHTATSKLTDGLELCRRITRRYGTNFCFATQFFPKEIREGIYAVYAFARIPDEIVDDPSCSDHDEAIRKLAAWRDSWLDAAAAAR
jgi:15-cis-phytoene synthase